MSFLRAPLSGPLSSLGRLFAVVAFVTLTLNGCAGLFGADPLPARRGRAGDSPARSTRRSSRR